MDVSEAIKHTMGFGPDVDVVDADGAVLPEVREVMVLARDSGVALALGYPDATELRAVIDAALDLGVANLVLAKPFSRTMQLGFDDAVAALKVSGAWLEINTLNSFHPAGGETTAHREDVVRLIRAVGSERVALSSDAGRAGLPGPAEALAAGCEAMLDEGFSEAQIRRMVVDNPSAILGR